MKVKLQLTYEFELAKTDSLEEYKKDVMDTAEMVFEEGTLSMQVDGGEVEVLDIPVD